MKSNDLLKPNDGLSNTIYIKRTVSSNKSLFIFGTLTAAAANAGSLFAISTAFNNAVTPEFALFGSLIGLLIAAIFSIIKYSRDEAGGKESFPAIFTFSTAALIIIAVFIFRNDIAGAIMGILSDFYKALGLTFIHANAPSLQNVEYLFPVIICSAAITLALCYGLTVKHSVATVVLLTFPVPALLLISGLFPAPAALCAMVAAVIAAAEYNKSDRVYSGFFAAIVAVICMVTANAVVQNTAVPFFEENDIPNIVTIYERITESIESGGSEAQPSYTAGAINHGDLSKIGNIKFTGDTLLEATFPKSKNTIFLRGFIASDYYNNKWYEQTGRAKQGEAEIAAAFSDKTVSPLLMDAANTLGAPAIEFSVRDLTDNAETVYLPYTLTVTSGENFLSADKTEFVFKWKSYSGEYFGAFDYEIYRRVFEFNQTLTDSEKAADEMLYRDFVYENYLELPDVFRGAEIVLDKDFYAFVGEEEGVDYDIADDMRIMSRKIYFIKNWLRENCEYDITVDEVPEGEDFVNYFLENTRAGSCSHFASSAVLLCRAAGIPARYAEGYVIKPRDFPETADDGESILVEIADTRAHAWVEVYIDEFGWYPFEFTSGYGNVRTTVTTETPKETTAATTTAVTSAPVSETTAVSQTETTAAVSSAPISEKETTEKEEIIALPEKAPSPLLLLLLIPAAIAIVPLRRTLILRRRFASIQKLHPEEAVYRAFGEIAPIMRQFGINPAGIYTDYEGFCEKLRESNIKEAEEVAKLAVNTAFGGYKPNSTDKKNALEATRKVKLYYYNSLSKKRRFYEKYFRVFL